MAIEEKIFFEDNTIKVTNLRLNYNHKTVPTDKITHVKCRMKVVNLTIAFICLLLSLPTVMFDKLGVFIIAVMFIWVWRMYSTYIELWITADEKGIKIKQTSIANGKYIHKIENSLNKARKDNQTIREEKGDFPHTKSMVLKRRLDELSDN